MDNITLSKVTNTYRRICKSRREKRITLPSSSFSPSSAVLQTHLSNKSRGKVSLFLHLMAFPLKLASSTLSYSSNDVNVWCCAFVARALHSPQTSEKINLSNFLGIVTKETSREKSCNRVLRGCRYIRRVSFPVKTRRDTRYHSC